MHKISPWYWERKTETDCIISASPEFLLRPLVHEEWHAHLIATNVSPTSGKIHGENCKGMEKAFRFFTVFGHGDIDDFFSDSLSDRPLAQMAKHPFIVKLANDGKVMIRSWPGTMNAYHEQRSQHHKSVWVRSAAEVMISRLFGFCPHAGSDAPVSG